MNKTEARCEAELAVLAARGRLRSFRPLRDRDGVHVCSETGAMLNLSSNDYLGLAGDRELAQRFYRQYENVECCNRFALGSTSSRLLAGDNDLAHTLENELAMSYGAEAALLFNSGYHINIGILPALYGKRDLILSDKLNHASIVDGTRLSLATTKRYRHLDYDHLRWLLNRQRADADRAVIVSESVFSMDGDVADLHQLVRLKREFAAELYIDEAHGLGLYGAHGLGKAEEAGLLAEIDYLVAVFGKAMASQGAFVICSETIRNYLINSARSLIFTTALPPVTVLWSLFVFRYMKGLASARKAVAELANRLRCELRANGLQTEGTTNIVPVIIGEDAVTVRLAERIQQQGFFVLPIRPPTVPAGTSRFRLSLTAGTDWQEIAELPAKIAEELRRVEGML